MIPVEIKFHLISEDGMPKRRKVEISEGKYADNFTDCLVIQRSGTITMATWSIAHQGFYSQAYKKYLNDVIAWAKVKASQKIMKQIEYAEEDKEEDERRKKQEQVWIIEGCEPIFR